MYLHIVSWQQRDLEARLRQAAVEAASQLSKRTDRRALVQGDRATVLAPEYTAPRAQARVNHAS